MAGNTEPTRSSASPTRNPDESQHSHFEIGSTGLWDREAPSDFAITSVNVPDRLDTQEVRARADADSERPAVRRFHRDDILRYARWLALAVGAVATVWMAVRFTSPLREAISAKGIESMVSSALGVPVSVADSELQFFPSPRIVVTGVTGQTGFHLPEVSVRFNWRDALSGLQSSSWVPGEARIAPVELSGTQALALLKSVRSAGGLPAGISTLRFESVSFTDLLLLPGRYEAILRRGAGKKEFETVAMSRLDGDGRFSLEVVPAAAPDGNARFMLFAQKWPATIGPPMTWKDVTAQGEFRADLLQVDSFTAAAQFGTFSGAARLGKDGRGWQLTGTLRSGDVSLEELIRHAARLGEGEARVARVPLRGSAKFELALAGSGASAEDALRRTTAVGPVSITGASLVGLNLGAAATQGSAAGAGGVTRLTDLDLDVVASSEGMAVRSLSGRAGSLRVHGSFQIDRKLQLNGTLRPEVRAPRGIASTQVRLGGTAAEATFQ